ncbi:MAG: flavin reductase family protein [Promethearchaeota archaeon]
MKKNLGQKNVLYPMPTTLIGALVNGKPNFITIAHVGIFTHTHISLGINKSHYTNQGIKESMSFSVNLPSENMVKITDYCGIVSGKKADKSGLFEIFYGELKNAPMIKECPVSMECKVTEILDYKTHDVFVGEIINTYCDEDIATERAVDLTKIKPLLFDMSSRNYFKLGEPFAKCWNIGKESSKQQIT